MQLSDTFAFKHCQPGVSFNINEKAKDLIFHCGLFKSSNPFIIRLGGLKLLVNQCVF